MYSKVEWQRPRFQYRVWSGLGLGPGLVEEGGKYKNIERKKREVRRGEKRRENIIIVSQKGED